MSEYEFVNVLGRATIEDYLALFRQSYGANQKLTAEYLRWLYEDNPHGRAIGLDAYLDGELAAHYVTIPRKYQVSGVTIPGVLSVNTATHPNHQRRGLFSRLAATTYERAAEEGFQFVVGVANAQSIHGFLTKLGFEHMGKIGLALWRKPPIIPPEHAYLKIDRTWLHWRLANPSAEYFMTGVGSDEVVVKTLRNKITFSLGRVQRALLPEDIVAARYQGCASFATLTPVFPKKGNGPFMPERFMPSPWHVILRRLGTGLDGMDKIHFNGLSMDTF